MKNDIATKAIWIEWRRPRTSMEKKRYGETVYTNDSTARIFINIDKCKRSSDVVMTFWHEMVHVFIHFFRTKPQLSEQKEEALCRKLERIIYEVIQ